MSVALVTGASGGLGSYLARKLAEAGYEVAVHCHDRLDRAAAVAEEILAKGQKALPFQADLTGEAGARKLIQEVSRMQGRLDVLINNAGVYTWAKNEDLTEEQWFAGLNSTATATFFTTRAALPLLRTAGQGRIVNIGDSGCDRPTARDQGLGYHIGKVGVLMITRSVAKAEARHGVTCNVVSPGYLDNSVDLAEAPKMPSGRFGTFDDIWTAVAFLLKPETAYLTGSNLVVSGGWNLR